VLKLLFAFVLEEIVTIPINISYTLLVAPSLLVKEEAKYPIPPRISAGITRASRADENDTHNGLESHINIAKAAVENFRSSDNRVLIDGHSLWLRTGGPEALIQLALAFRELLPNATYFFFDPDVTVKAKFTIDPRFLTEYPNATAINTISSAEFKRGDILILPELRGCNTTWVDSGVKVYMWVLRSLERRPSYHSEMVAAGCRTIAHNNYIRDESLQWRDHRPYLLRPYVTPSLLPKPKVTFQARTERIIWINAEVGGDLVKVLQDVCTSPTYNLTCKAQKIEGIPQYRLPVFYQRGTIVFEQSMKGSERSILEAVIHGNIFVTTNRLGGKNRMDLPMPERNMLASNATSSDFAPVFRRIFEHYEEEWRDYETFRRLYRDELSHNSLVSEVKSFLWDISERQVA